MIKSKAYISRQFHQPIIALILCTSSAHVQAAIVSDNSERRIQVRQSTSSNNGGNAYITPSSTLSSQRPGVTMLSGEPSYNAGSDSADSMQRLIAQKQRDFEIDASLSIKENKRVNVVRRPSSFSTSSNTYNSVDHDDMDMNFNAWLNSNRYRASQIAEYQRYLAARLGAQNVPPMSQMLTTARSWSQCGHEPYEVPPQELWNNIVPTLRLYSELKNQGVLPPSSEIRSVYRNPGLNVCAGGANDSKHMHASAIDIWVPEYEDNPWRLSTMQDGLCQFWQYQGQAYNFGLGLYATGAIHLDTDGYRKWGFNHASSSSSCRY